MLGVPLRQLQELMGHKTIAMTCRYAHLAPQHQLDAVSKLDGWGKQSQRQLTPKLTPEKFRLSGVRQLKRLKPLCNNRL